MSDRYTEGGFWDPKTKPQAADLGPSGEAPREAGTPLGDLNLAAAKFNSFPPREELKELGKSLITEIAALREKYFALLNAVENKYAGESRHETALRFIRQAGLAAPKPKAEGYKSKSNPGEPSPAEGSNPANPMSDDVRTGLRLILRSYIYTNHGVIGATKEWIEEQLAAPPGVQQGEAT